jgi:hypothetical protein
LKLFPVPSGAEEKVRFRMSAWLRVVPKVHVSGLSLLAAVAAVVCLLPAQSFAQFATIDSGQYAAKAIQISGRVSVLRDAVEYAVEVGGEVRVKELIFTGPDGSARFQVSDGSTFDVYPNSRVIFRKNVPNWRDLLDVLVGRVKVRIQHWGTEPNHNRVLTPTAVISVRGTTFDISVDDDDETTLVEVEEGVVEVQHALLPRGNPKVLTTGESLRVFRNEPLALNRFDKGTIFKQAMRIGMDAISTWESRIPHGGGAGGSGSGSGSGDTHKTPPPPTTGSGSTGAPGGGLGPPGGGFMGSGHAVYVHGHYEPRDESRIHKIGRNVWHVVSRIIFGESAEQQVIRAAGH